MMEKDKFAVFGNPIKQSKSPIIHTLFAQQYAQHIEYRAVRVELDDFVQATNLFFEGGGAGLNITVPFKHEAFALAHRNSERSLRAGAVNVLTLADDGLIDGDNTDGIGLIRDLIANLGWTVQGLRVLLVGAGGAARGVLEPLLRERPRELLVVNRTAARAADLAVEFAGIGPLEGGACDLIGTRQFDLIINATSAGLSGAVPELPSSMLTERRAVTIWSMARSRRRSCAGQLTMPLALCPTALVCWWSRPQRRSIFGDNCALRRVR